MAIVSKVELAARRAAAQAAAAAAAAPPAPAAPAAAPAIQVRSRVRRPEVEPPAPPPAPQPKRRGHATRDERNKWQPTGDYAEGWCRPPEATRFKKGGKPGPGRPKGSASHDTLLKRQLELKQRVRVDGREKQLSRREIMIAKEVLDGVEGKSRDARKYLLGESARLYAAPAEADGSGAVAGTELTASDLLSLEEYEAELRARIRAELEAELAGRAARPGAGA